MKQDARRCGVPFLNPCVNRSGVGCVPSGDSVLLGMRFVKDVGAASARLIVEERERHGPYAGAVDLVRRVGLKPQAVESLVMAGAFDSLVSNRRQVLWEAGLGIPPSKNGQRSFLGAVNGDVPNLPDFTAYEKTAGEYRVMGIYPRGHLMEFVRPSLDSRVLPAAAVDYIPEGEEVLVAGWPIARQHPKGPLARNGNTYAPGPTDPGASLRSGLRLPSENRPPGCPGSVPFRQRVPGA